MRRYSEYKGEKWYLEGVEPKGIVEKLNRIKIGNGVIAGAGTIITKDVQDYAVVMGAPARIIRYRYTPEQIELLNRIQWWNWTEEVIQERYDI